MNEALVIDQPHALLTVQAEELRNMFNAVLAHREIPDPDEDESEMLSQLHLEVRDGRLRLVCSDKYTMGVYQRPLTSVHEGFACSYALSGDAVRVAVSELAGPLAHLLIEKESVRFVGSGWTTVIPATKSFLTWRKALASLLSPESVPVRNILLNPDFLARFQAAKPLHPQVPMLFHLRGEEKALIATLGDDFIAFVMPARREKSQESSDLPAAPLDPWFDLVDED